MRIYVSGKMGGLSESTIKSRFGEAEARIRAKGHVPLNPANMMRYPLTWTEFMELDLQLLEFADAMLLLEGWEDSEGARLEVQYALENGLAVFCSIDQIYKEAEFE